MKIRYTDEEYTAVASAAAAAGLTPTGYAGEAALAAARDSSPPSTAPWRQALLELMAARGQVRRFGSNVNQAARALNALGETPEWLDRAVAVTELAVIRLDEAAATVALAARGDRTRPGRSAVTVSDAHGAHTSDTHTPARPIASRRTANDAHATAAHHGSQRADSGRVLVTDLPAQEGSA